MLLFMRIITMYFASLMVLEDSYLRYKCKAFLKAFGYAFLKAFGYAFVKAFGYAF